jgi:hypothetical protein
VRDTNITTQANTAASLFINPSPSADAILHTDLKRTALAVFQVAPPKTTQGNPIFCQRRLDTELNCFINNRQIPGAQSKKIKTVFFSYVSCFYIISVITAAPF